MGRFWGITGFNPCFDGLPFWTFIGCSEEHWDDRFNPCFDGLPFWTSICFSSNFSTPVSILVLMDYLFGLRERMRVEVERIMQFQSLF